MLFSTAWETSPSRPPSRAAVTPAHMAASHAADRAAAPGVTSPTGTVIAASPCQPSTIAPKSMEIRSPAASRSCADGMPWTTRSLTDVQITAGKP